jgi:signal peptidase I
MVYSLATGLFFSNMVLENDTMKPGMVAGDRFIFSSYTLNHLFMDKLPFRRGQVVLVDRSAGERRITKTILDAMVRFGTLQRISLFNREDTVFVKRVLALPGDTVSIDNFVLRIKPAGQDYEFTEFELSEKDYIPDLPQVSLLWDESIPFSDSMDSITLGEGQCFVLSDDRSNTNDSRSWGPVPSDAIVGRALLRYWPLVRIGVP